MRWIVGIDLRARSHGAVAFVSWARQHAKAQAFIAAHAMPEPSTSLGEPPIDRDELHAQSLEVLRKELAARGAEQAFDDHGLIESWAPEDGLVEVMRRHGADGLVIGRRANKVDDAWIRLGRVARRLLRTLPAPIITVPADLEVGDLAQGPVLLTTDLSQTSVAALAFAARFAHELGRPLQVAHVIEAAGRMVPAKPADAWHMRPDAPPSDPGALDRWLEEHTVQGAKTLVERGHVLETLGEIVERQRPCLVVCGSRSLSTMDRIFTSSVASALAGVAPVPVAVIPADWTPSK